jgi:hypothetical protein
MTYHDDEAGEFPGGQIGFYLFMAFAWTFAILIGAVQWIVTAFRSR